jgi:hypothetical protein
MFVAINEGIAKGVPVVIVSSASRLCFSSDFGHIAASHRPATKSADARRGAAHGGELRQAAGAVAAVAPISEA